MSEPATLARPYATAVFKRAKETDSMGVWSNTLFFLSALSQDKSIAVLIDDPNIAKTRLSTLLLDISHEQINTEGENFLKLLIQNGRLSLVAKIAEQFEQFKAEYEGYVDVDVFSAFAFAQDEQKKFAATLEKMLNKQVHMNVTVDKSLIGGVLVRAGDRVFDGSIKGQLQQLAKRL